MESSATPSRGRATSGAVLFAITQANGPFVYRVAPPEQL
jgi:hypothetical protein